MERGVLYRRFKFECGWRWWEDGEHWRAEIGEGWRERRGWRDGESFKGGRVKGGREGRDEEKESAMDG